MGGPDGIGGMAAVMGGALGRKRRSTRSRMTTSPAIPPMIQGSGLEVRSTVERPHSGQNRASRPTKAPHEAHLEELSVTVPQFYEGRRWESSALTAPPRELMDLSET